MPVLEEHLLKVVIMLRGAGGQQIFTLNVAKLETINWVLAWLYQHFLSFFPFSVHKISSGEILPWRKAIYRPAPGPGHTKDYKIGSRSLLTWPSVLRVDEGTKVEGKTWCDHLWDFDFRRISFRDKTSRILAMAVSNNEYSDNKTHLHTKCEDCYFLLTKLSM